MPESQSNPNPEAKPNTTGEPIPARKSRREKLVRDFPNSGKQVSRRMPTIREEILIKLGLSESDMEGVPRVKERVKEAVGSVEEAILIISGDDSPDSVRFTAKWNSLTVRQQRRTKIEEVITAAGMTPRRFMELLVGAAYDHGEMMSNFYKSRKKLDVLKSTVKTATGRFADVKAQELFFKITGDIKPSGGVVVNSNNQTANITAAPERQPLSSMDSFLLELDEVRKPKQLNAPPVIPVEMPEGAPEIEYLQIED